MLHGKTTKCAKCGSYYHTSVGHHCSATGKVSEGSMKDWSTNEVDGNSRCKKCDSNPCQCDRLFPKY